MKFAHSSILKEINALFFSSLTFVPFRCDGGNDITSCPAVNPYTLEERHRAVRHLVILVESDGIIEDIEV